MLADNNIDTTDRNSILIIDDDVSVSSAFRYALSSHYDVRVACTLQDGLEQIYRSSPHLVILDVCLPDQAGLAGLEQIHDYNSEIPVLVITGYPNYESAVEALRQGASNYLEKPIRPKHLLDCVSTAIRKKRRLSWSQNISAAENLESQPEAAEMIHDLSNGLTALEFSVYTKIQQSTSDSSDPFLTGLLAQIENINRLLEYWRDHEIDKGLSNDACSLKDLVDAAKESAVFLSDRKELEVVWNHRAVDERVIVAMPEVPFCRILGNLLDNAVAAMDGEAGKKRLTIQFKIKRQRCLIFVSDTGKGISRENMTKLFSKHWTTKQEKKHHGIGLLFLERMVKQHGGIVCFTSTEGRGTTFVVNLPLG